MTRPSFLAELKRRNVWRAAALYVGAIWALAQGIASLGPSFGMPEWGTRWFVIAGAIGFPLWLAFAWFYEWTPEGFKREREVEAHESITHRTGRKLDFAIIGVLALAVVLLLTDRFVLRQGVNQKLAATISAKSIAVLPFADMSQAKDQEYFSDGISEELLNLLAKLPQLHVAARTSSFSFKGKDTPIPEIAKALGVAHVLEGSVRKSGDQVRITTQLIRAADGYHVWSETYDRKLEDIFAIQDEVAEKVVGQLKVTLLGAAPKARATNPEAYALYLQARQYRRQYTAEALRQSDALLQQALAIDPLYVPAWVAVGHNRDTAVAIGVLPVKEGYIQAREAADKALAIDPDYAPGHALLSRIAAYGDGNSPAAARHLARALALDPASLDVLQASVTLLSSLGRLEEALKIGEAIVRRDPVNDAALYMVGNIQRNTGRLDPAIASFRTAIGLNPGSGGTHAQLGIAMLLKGDGHGALAEFEKETVDGWRMIGLPMAYHALGRKAESDAALSALIEKYEKQAAFNIAFVHAFRGDADKTFEWLAKEIEYTGTMIPEIVADSLFANVRSDPRWLALLRKLGLAPEQLAKIEFEVSLPADWKAEAAAASAEAGAKR